MSYRCPKCQSPKIMPVASSNSVRPEIPKSLAILVPSVLFLLLFVSISLAFLVLDKKMGLLLQLATIASFLIFIASGFMFWKALPKFKQSMQTFMRAQKHWKCRQCNHDWQNS
ncbi:hypothetical protein F4V57_11085 [Acinetobacter qingfengensis]|uniref:Uncharacterized protein n=1 Tax=Acinetobacter qingfengensis TaxID=1262585 RepID=A0A1E7RD62_9GAMM|nr:hypothetical protein [Acinetobacter qingfengensis]KAA8732153.1 hypothetical protein F4V57_11085 [Acinetobacter qingfengensis]OEY97233.1 hypothetical protein BJI46_02070 [Acinetobacter qingfengensis]